MRCHSQVLKILPDLRAGLKECFCKWMQYAILDIKVFGRGKTEAGYMAVSDGNVVSLLPSCFS